ncbi:DUF1345 domain-containing protein [Roseomonas sp. BN140053]|uniref:DUF1345 domain-containing protein n=1 Tax=Roseomonas sp. BN140053 TaxID=3391898 RepID=UPI0039EBD571
MAIGSGLRLHRRPGLRAALLAGPAAWLAVVLALDLRSTTALLLGWDVAVLAYLAMLLRAALSMDPSAARKQAEELDEGRWTVLGGTLLTVLAALVAVGADLAGAQGAPNGAEIGLAVATVLLSWSFLHVLFANHYLHEQALRGGIDFPGGAENPDLLEFLYLSFTVGMTAQVSDVTTASAGMRRLVLVHAVVSFVFNTAVVAGAVNIAAGLVK